MGKRLLKSFSLKKLLTDILLLFAELELLTDAELRHLKLNNNIAESKTIVTLVDNMIDFIGSRQIKV